MRLATILTSAFLFAVLTGCGGGDSGGPTPPSTRQDSASTVIGTGGGLVVTPNGDAGVQIPPGVLGQNATITVTKLPAPGTPGQGPLPTSLSQYGPFYEVSISPANAQLGDSVRVGVCQVTDISSPFYAPEATHGQLRLAHTVGGATEILEPVGVSDFLNCTGVTASTDMSAGRSRVGRTFASLLNHTLGFLAPTTLHAAHGGLGGKVKSFSPFGAVNPLTGLVIGPEIAVAASPSLEEDLGGAAYDGTNYLVVFSVRNGSGQVVPRVQLVSSTGALVGPQVALPGSTGGNALVAFDGTNYLIVWEGPGTILGRFINRTATVSGATFTIATANFPSPSTLVFGGGTYLLVYTQEVNVNSDYGHRSFGRVISPSGVVGPELQLGSVLGNSGLNNAAFDGTNFFFVYTDSSRVRGRFVSPAGVLGQEPTIFTATNAPIVSIGFNGTNYLVSFASGAPSFDGFAQLVNKSGATVGNRISLTSGGSNALPVGVTASGTNFVVSYIDSLTVFGATAVKARVVSASGSTKLPAFRIAGTSGGRAPAGFLVNFDGSNYFGILLRGLQPQNDPASVDNWTQKDLFAISLTVPIPP